MASNKNQHFVPRCLLKPFTVDAANLAINVFNLDRVRFIRNAAVKHQCSGDYFYGEDELLERALQAMEHGYGRLVGEIIQPGYRLNDSHRQLLRRFWLLQHMRKDAASRRSVEMQARVTEAIGSPADEFRSTIKESVHIAMRVFAESMDLIDDMKVCLIRNRTGIPFVTGDDPAVMSNRWHLEDARVSRQSSGLGSAGALMFLPITPEILCLIYDGDIYSVPHSDGWTDAKRDTDTEAFNQQRFLNCWANVYFRDWDKRKDIDDQFRAVSAQRPTARHRVYYAAYDHSEGEWERYRVVNRPGMPEDGRGMVHWQSVLPAPTVWPRQIAWRNSGYA